MEVNKSQLETYLQQNRPKIESLSQNESYDVDELYSHFDLHCQNLVIPREKALTKCAVNSEQLKASEGHYFIRFRPSKYSILISTLELDDKNITITHRFYPPTLRLHQLMQAVLANLSPDKRCLVFVPSRAHRRRFDIEHIAAQCSRAAIKRYIPQAMVSSNDFLIRVQETCKLNATGQECYELLENLPAPSKTWRQSPLAQHYFHCIAEAANQDMVELIKIQSPML